MIEPVRSLVPLFIGQQFNPTERSLKEPILDFSKLNFDNPVADRDAIMEINPHRFEMMLLDAVVYADEEHAAGYLDVCQDAFWTRGHFPGRPIMPGVLICESAAQLTSYYALTNDLVDEGIIVGLGGLENVRFRGQVVPGDRLTLMFRRHRVRRNQMFTANFQGWVDQTMVVDGMIRGVALGER